ncbi:MAG TPA: thiamine pyrophosphate-dependent enzyme, partial [Nitrososphaerales archaeon]|nr:thiamine pyrophosphate-dependent enzyme [Nitrososphaerales archaeon]
EEGTTVASAFALRKSDWMFTSYRETGSHLTRGLTLDLMLAQLFGNSNDLLKGRQMSNSWGSKVLNNVPTAAPIGAYLPMAVGCAMAAKLKRDKIAVLTYMGDGGTSSSDFHTAMNFAGVFNAPIVFVCRNNGWAISLPVSRQTASSSIAIKAKAYGFPGILVDGNDPLAIFVETKKALDDARNDGGPTLIEALTYRLGAHSTADDPSRYRDKEETIQWEQKDPIVRLRKYLISLHIWSVDEDKELLATYEQMVSAAVGRQESTGIIPIPELFFDDVYSTLPWFLNEQKDELSSFLRDE